MRNSYSLHIRLNLSDEEQRKAWESLAGMDRARHQSYNKVVAKAINAYFSRCEQPIQAFSEADKQLIDAYVNRIVGLVNDTLKETLPAFLAGCLAGSINAVPVNNNASQPKSSEENELSARNAQIDEADIDWDFLNGS